MTDRTLRIALTLLCLAGIVVAGYLLATRYGDAPLLCSTGGCETVQSSSYAALLGIPVAALGLVSYALVAATAWLDRSWMREAGAALALGAVLFSAYLLVVQLVVVDAVCDWCIANDAVVSLVAIAAVLRLRGAALPQGPGSSSPSASA